MLVIWNKNYRVFTTKNICKEVNKSFHFGSYFSKNSQSGMIIYFILSRDWSDITPSPSGKLENYGEFTVGNIC